MIPASFWHVCSAISFDSQLQSACVQAEATREAGKQALVGSTRGMIGALAAGIMAIVAGFFVLIAAVLQTHITHENERARATGTFLGELRAVERFFREMDVVGSLEAAAAADQRLWFHPGTSWLQSYNSDPTKLGLLSGELPQKLAYVFARMRGEFGRLTWLHELSDAQTKKPDGWLASEQRRSAANVKRLLEEVDILIVTLEAEYRQARLASEIASRLLPNWPELLEVEWVVT